MSAIGHGSDRVKEAIAEQLDQIAYRHPGFYQTECVQNLARFLVNSAQGKWHELSSMAQIHSFKVYEWRVPLTDCYDPGSEAAIKLARQYFWELSPTQTNRYHLIASKGSWHGCTLAALSVGDLKARKTIYEPILPGNVSRVSACNVYRDLALEMPVLLLLSLSSVL